MTEIGMVPVSYVAELDSENRSTNQFHKDGETYLSNCFRRSCEIF